MYVCCLITTFSYYTTKCLTPHALLVPFLLRVLATVGNAAVRSIWTPNFSIARGNVNQPPMEMTKWCDTH